MKTIILKAVLLLVALYLLLALPCDSLKTTEWPVFVKWLFVVFAALTVLIAVVESEPDKDK